MARLKPLPRKERLLQVQPVQNRGRELRRDKDDVKNIEVGLLDVDAAIMYYFENVIQPKVTEQGEEVKVPLFYANPERWKAIRRDGYLRDTKRQLITPLIVFRRTSMSKSPDLPMNKIDANDPKLFYTFEKKYTSENRYNRFAVDRGLLPQKEFYNVAMPDYVTLNYECIIWTAYIEQMNKIIESVNWSAGTYWGEPGKLRFRTNIDSFEDSTEMAEGERYIKTIFSLQLYGYLVPEKFNDVLTTYKYITPKKLDFVDETDFSISTIYNPNQKAETVRAFGGAGRGTSAKSGLAGATDFIRGKSYAAGQETQDLEFTNTYGGDTRYVMRYNGIPTSSADSRAVLNLQAGDNFFRNNVLNLSGSQSSSATSTAQLYDLQIQDTGSYNVRTGSLSLSINGVAAETSNDNLSTTGGNDFFLTGSSTYPRTSLAVRKAASSLSPGFNLLDSDRLIIRFQKELK